jgi:hypothetical protein
MPKTIAIAITGKKLVDKLPRPKVIRISNAEEQVTVGASVQKPTR